MIQSPAFGREQSALRRDGRVDYGACLENRCGISHRGFESLSLRFLMNIDK
jgi:hypothetical protein